MKKLITTGLLGAVLLVGGAGLAKRPPRNVSPARHPNLAAAQRHIDQAYKKVTDAQRANEFDLGGHAAKAKDLLEQAAKELKEAAEYANKN